MLITDDIYNDFSKRIKAGEFLRHSIDEATSMDALPTLDQMADHDAKAFHEQCQQTLNLYLAKINALRARLASECKKQESKMALDEANSQTIDFNTILENKYAKLLKKTEEETNSNKKALKALQELSDKVLEENKRLKEENSKLKEENDKWQATFDRENDEMVGNTPSQAEWESRQEFEKWKEDSTSKSIKEVIEFCVNYASDIEDVSDSHVETIKDMMEDLLESSLAELLLDSDKLELTKKLHGIKRARKKQLSARNKEIKEKNITNNNYYAPIEQQINSAEKATIEKQKGKQNNKENEQRQ